MIYIYYEYLIKYQYIIIIAIVVNPMPSIIQSKKHQFLWVLHTIQMVLVEIIGFPKLSILPEYPNYFPSIQPPTRSFAKCRVSRNFGPRLPRIVFASGHPFFKLGWPSFRSRLLYIHIHIYISTLINFCHIR